MGSLDAMFGRIFDNGVEKEIRGALNFTGFTIEPYNDPATGRPAGWTVRASALGIVGVGTYLGELAKWNGSAWVPAADGLVSAKGISPVSGDGTKTNAFIGTGNVFVGATRLDEEGDGLTYVRAVMRGEAPANDPDEISGEAQINAVDQTGAEHLGFRTAYQVTGENPAGIRHGAYGHAPAAKPTVPAAPTALQVAQALQSIGWLTILP